MSSSRQRWGGESQEPDSLRLRGIQFWPWLDAAREGLQLPALGSDPFTERNFPGRLVEDKMCPQSERAALAAAESLGKSGTLEMGKLKRYG